MEIQNRITIKVQYVINLKGIAIFILNADELFKRASLFK